MLIKNKSTSRNKIEYPCEPQFIGVNLVDWSRTRYISGRCHVWVECRECPVWHGRWQLKFRVESGRCLAAARRMSGQKQSENSGKLTQDMLAEIHARGDQQSKCGSTIFWTQATIKSNRKSNLCSRIGIPYQCVCGKNEERRGDNLARCNISKLFLCQSCSVAYPLWLAIQGLGIESLKEYSCIRAKYLQILITRQHPYSDMARFRGTGPFCIGTVRMHRYVMASHLGRSLDPSEIVHHRDSNPSNNDISNLEILEANKHTVETRVESAIRQELRARIKILEAENTYLLAKMDAIAV